MRDFLLDRVRLVRHLLGNCGPPQVHYADLVLILTSVISACAALRFPGNGIDKRRFIELLVRNTPDDFHLSWISVPTLIAKGLISESVTAYAEAGQSTRIFRDEEIDREYCDARQAFPRVPFERLKSCSYAVLIYEWLRCGYAHEYCPHENITHVPASRGPARVSYIGRMTRSGLKRMVSFHLDYLIEVAEHHAANVSDTPSSQPPTWWLDSQ
jgi:hypothetical protein